jgi:hypothetical protein
MMQADAPLEQSTRVWVSCSSFRASLNFLSDETGAARRHVGATKQNGKELLRATILALQKSMLDTFVELLCEGFHADNLCLHRMRIVALRVSSDV